MSEIDQIKAEIAEAKADVKQIKSKLAVAESSGDRDMILVLNKRLTGLEEDLRRKEMSIASGNGIIAWSILIISFDCFLL
jgi:hypothetical protein